MQSIEGRGDPVLEGLGMWAPRGTQGDTADVLLFRAVGDGFGPNHGLLGKGKPANSAQFHHLLLGKLFLKAH